MSSFQPSMTTTPTFGHAVDQTLRKLQIPPKFQPYMENHRIGELFAQLVKDLVVEKPNDVLMFMKKFFDKQITEGRDVPKLIFFCPPNLHTVDLANQISRQTGCTPVWFKDILPKPYYSQFESEKSLDLSSVKSNSEILNMEENQTPDLSLNSFNGNLQSILENESWNLGFQGKMKPQVSHLSLKALSIALEKDKASRANRKNSFGKSEVVKTPDDLVKLLESKLRDITSNSGGWILMDFPRNKEEALALYRHNIIPTHVFSIRLNSPLRQISEEHYLNMLQLEEIYHYFLKKIHVCGKNIETIGNVIAEAIKVPVTQYVKITPRVVIIGTRGSGRRSIGQKLSKNLKLVYLDKIPNFMKSSSSQSLAISTILSRLAEEDCVKNGYVLVGVPRNVVEFQMLDKSDNPPNRVIFLSVSDEVCLNRLKHRRVNMYTGEVSVNPELMKDKHLREMYSIHPDDEIERIVKDQKSHRDEVMNMLKYCGESGVVIDAECSIGVLYERVKKVVEGPTPISDVRSCQLSQHDSQDTFSSNEEDKLETNGGEESLEKQEMRQATCVDINRMKFSFPFSCVQPNRDIRSVLNEIRET